MYFKFPDINPARPIDVSFVLPVSCSPLSFSKQKLVAVGGFWNCSVRIFSSRDGSLLRSLLDHVDIVTCVAFSSDGNLLASGSKVHIFIDFL